MNECVLCFWRPTWSGDLKQLSWRQAVWLCPRCAKAIDDTRSTVSEIEGVTALVARGYSWVFGLRLAETPEIWCLQDPPQLQYEIDRKLKRRHTAPMKIAEADRGPRGWFDAWITVVRLSRMLDRDAYGHPITIDSITPWLRDGYDPQYGIGETKTSYLDGKSKAFHAGARFFGSEG